MLMKRGRIFSGRNGSGQETPVTWIKNGFLKVTGRIDNMFIPAGKISNPKKLKPR